MRNYLQTLKERKIEYEIRKYPKAIRDTTLVAQYINIPQNQLFKSLVVVATNSKPLLVMIPSNMHLLIEELQTTLGIYSLRFATLEQAERYTGMKVGGISPLGILDKQIPIYISDAVLLYDWIVMSAGERGVSVKIATKDLLNIIEAKTLIAKAFTKEIATN